VPFPFLTRHWPHASWLSRYRTCLNARATRSARVSASAASPCGAMRKI